MRKRKCVNAYMKLAKEILALINNLEDIYIYTS